MESREEIARAQGILQQPEVFGHEVGFTDLTRLHGEWIWEMVFGKEDYTLQAHRGSYKSSCLAIAIALRMVIFRRENIIFLRKADNDVSEMLAMVGKILRSDPMRGLVYHLLSPGTELTITSEGADHITTNLFCSPMGAQLDVLGDFFGIPRQYGWNDTTYRDYIRKKLEIWRWDGTNSTVGDVLAGQPGARMIDNGDGTVTVEAGGVYPIPAGIGCTLA